MQLSYSNNYEYLRLISTDVLVYCEYMLNNPTAFHKEADTISKHGQSSKSHKSRTFFLMLLLSIICFNFIGCQSQTSSNDIGKQLFLALQSSNADEFAKYFLSTRDGNDLYQGLQYKGSQRDINWSKIQYLDYLHKEFDKDGNKYSAGFLAFNSNGTDGYTVIGAYLLSIKTNNGYKILKFNDKWSRSEWSNDAIESITENLENLGNEWLD